MRLHEVIFEADTPAGFAFDVLLIAAIVLSMFTIIADSVEPLHLRFGTGFLVLEYVFTVMFTVEYIARLLAVRRPLSYATSFFGLVDLISILPTWLAFFVPGVEAFIAVRMLRILRIFRVFKLATYLAEAQVLVGALRRGQRKITVFMAAVGTSVVVMGSLMYAVEGPENGFTSIPVGIYWAVVTITTVGYGDISPATPIGQALSIVIMLLGYGIIAVPTGIVSSELVNASRHGHDTRCCPACAAEGHDADAVHCKYCAANLTNGAPPA